MKWISFTVDMVSTRLFFSQSQTVRPPNCLIYSTDGLKISPLSPIKRIFTRAYTLRLRPRHAMYLWSPDKHVPLQSKLDFLFPKVTLANYSFSRMYITVQFLFRKAAVHIASWYSSSVIVAYRQINASLRWSKATPQLFKATLLLCAWGPRHRM